MLIHQPGDRQGRLFDRLDVQLLAFSLVAVVAQLSGILDADLAHVPLYVISCVLLVGRVVLGHVVRVRPQNVLIVCAPLLYIASATLLILSQAQASTGLSIVLLLPVVLAAIRQERLHSAVVIVAVLSGLATINFVHHSGWLVSVRVLVLWFAMSVVVSFTIHELRDRLRAVQDQLAEQARTDPLTGLANRRRLHEVLEQRRGAGRFMMLAIDVDGLKELNDSQGHAAGDELLQGVARACESAVRPGDLVARIGGDEFAMFIAGDDRADSQVISRRIEEAIGLVVVNGFRARASVGVATGRPGDDPSEVLQQADFSMYESKRINRQRADRRTDGALG